MTSRRVRTELSSASRTSAPADEDVRRQLEGGLETLEAARRRYASLESSLASRRWMRRLHRQPELLRTVLRQEPVLEEAMDRIHRRARTEQWPEELPVLATLQQVRALRGRLESLVRKRLGTLAPVSGASSLGEDLSRLEELIPPPVSLEPIEGEVTLAEGTTTSVARLWEQPVFCLCAIALASVVVRTAFEAGLIGGMMSLVGSLVSNWLRSGTYRLTSERLLWMPRRGEPVQIPLRSISEDGIQLSRGLRVVGEREIFLSTGAVHLFPLALQLEMHRHPPLLGNVDPRHQVDAVCYAATLEVGVIPRQGCVVVRPDYVAFIPWDAGPQVLRILIGRRSSLPESAIGVVTLFEQLRYLQSEAAFDDFVKRAVFSTRGERWSAAEVRRHDVGTLAWEKLDLRRIDQPQTSLIGKVARTQQEQVERLLAHWAKR